MQDDERRRFDGGDSSKHTNQRDGRGAQQQDDGWQRRGRGRQSVSSTLGELVKDCDAVRVQGHEEPDVIVEGEEAQVELGKDCVAVDVQGHKEPEGEEKKKGVMKPARTVSETCVSTETRLQALMRTKSRETTTKKSSVTCSWPLVLE